MNEVLSFLLIFVFMFSITIFLYINHRRLNSLEKVADGNNEELDTRMTQLIQGINYNDKVLSSEQVTLQAELETMEKELTEIRKSIIENEAAIQAMKEEINSVATFDGLVAAPTSTPSSSPAPAPSST